MANSASPTAMADSTRISERVTVGILFRHVSDIFGFAFKPIPDLRLLTPGLCAFLLAICISAEAQQPTKLPRIGYLSTDSPSTIAVRIEAFREGLRELGYVEGKNIVIEWRFAEGKADRLRGLAAELVRLNVNVIVTSGPAATRAAKEATVTIPIVTAQDNDPVGNGLVASLARPGAN